MGARFAEATPFSGVGGSGRARTTDSAAATAESDSGQ